MVANSRRIERLLAGGEASASAAATPSPPRAGMRSKATPAARCGLAAAAGGGTPDSAEGTADPKPYPCVGGPLRRLSDSCGSVVFDQHLLVRPRLGAWPAFAGVS